MRLAGPAATLSCVCLSLSLMRKIDGDRLRVLHADWHSWSLSGYISMIYFPNNIRVILCK